MQLFSSIFNWHRKSFVPSQFPHDYRALFFLAFLQQDFHFLAQLFSFPRPAEDLCRAQQKLYDYALDFILSGTRELLSLNDAGLFARKALSFDPHEIALRLSEVFMEELSEKRRINLEVALSWSPDSWRHTVEAVNLCHIFDQETPLKEAPVYNTFLQKVLQKAGPGCKQSVMNKIDFRLNLYFYYYCSVSSMGLLQESPRQLDYCRLCSFIYSVLSQSEPKIVAAMAAVRLYQIFSSGNLDLSFKGELDRLYKQALFDRSRKAFSLPGMFSSPIFVNPDSRELSLIFIKNSL